ncbi:unnamed protein product [Didymodactylos carnosus]|uniref:Uncharacterized protein n=1 Tax=Didymodactylos carnosus TaxID=1234261 RepID=A0A814IX39_9BILA|nr:unnamed protein product [Didymodactylos carnosus]CAF3800615.1 unnamed protein product [Didymodactylos carnosus]
MLYYFSNSALIVARLAVMIIIIMGVLKYFVKHPGGKKLSKLLKCIFKQTDVIGEGELWVGGLASFSVVALVSFGCAFSNGYLKQYPPEHASDLMMSKYLNVAHFQLIILVVMNHCLINVIVHAEMVNLSVKKLDMMN